jgi:hypothetical protein
MKAMLPSTQAAASNQKDILWEQLELARQWKSSSNYGTKWKRHDKSVTQK